MALTERFYNVIDNAMKSAIGDKDIVYRQIPFITPQKESSFPTDADYSWHIMSSKKDLMSLIVNNDQEVQDGQYHDGFDTPYAAANDAIAYANFLINSAGLGWGLCNDRYHGLFNLYDKYGEKLFTVELALEKVFKLDTDYGFIMRKDEDMEMEM